MGQNSVCLEKGAKNVFDSMMLRMCSIKTIFSVQGYLDFALADSVLQFNDGKGKHVGIIRQMGLDVGIHSHIYY